MDTDNVVGILMFVVGVIAGVVLCGFGLASVDKDVLNDICADQTDGEYPIYKDTFGEAGSIVCINEEKIITLYQNAATKNQTSRWQIRSPETKDR